MLEELPKLSPRERRELVLRLFEINSTRDEAEDIAISEHSATIGFSMLDQMEAEDSSS